MTPKQAIKAAKNIHPYWVAQDKNGAWYAYENKPRISDYDDEWVMRSRYNQPIELSATTDKPARNWKQSLREVV